MVYAVEGTLLLLGIIGYAAIETYLELRRDQQQIAEAERAARTALMKARPPSRLYSCSQ
jgi:hypothetical protein